MEKVKKNINIFHIILTTILIILIFNIYVNTKDVKKKQSLIENDISELKNKYDKNKKINDEIIIKDENKLGLSDFKLLNTALQNYDLSICEKINSENTKSNCYTLVEFNSVVFNAYENKDIKMCEKLDEEEIIKACKENYILKVENEN